MSYAKKKKKVHVNAKTSHIFQLSFPKWMKLVSKIPRGSDASFFHVRSTQTQHLPTSWYLKTKTTSHQDPFLTPIAFNGFLSQCWLQKHFASTVISLEAEVYLRDGEVEQLGRKMDLGVTLTWFHIQTPITYPKSCVTLNKLVTSFLWALVSTSVEWRHYYWNRLVVK